MRTNRITTIGLCSMILLLAEVLAPNLWGQGRRPIPAEEYYAGLRAIAAGNFNDAETIYRHAIDDAVQIGSMPWLDSICYHAMYGEVLYHFGQIDAALGEWETAIDIYLQNKGWLGRVDYLMSPTTSDRMPVPWGDGERPVPVGVFPKEATIITGDVLTKERLQQGGMIAQQEMHRIDPIAILRCTALSIRRRNEVLGPLTPSDPRSAEMLTCFSTRSVAPNHWSVTWLDVLFGLSLQASGKEAEGEKVLAKSLLMAGQYDHSLTACALLALGDGYWAAGKADEAATCFLEASISAYQYGEFSEAAEGLEKYADASRSGGNRTAAALDTGLKWCSSSHKTALLSLVLLLATAENSLDAGLTGDAENRLHSAETILRSFGLTESRWADRWHRLAARVDYAAGNAASGDENLVIAVKGAAVHSLRLYQLGRLERMLQQNNEWDITPRVASELYAVLLRASDAVDWATAPLETLAFEANTGSEPFENWFAILMNRNMPDQAFEVAERTRQVRYLSSLDFGGRPAAIRMLLETPSGRLAETLRPIQAALLEKHPDYAEAAKKDAELMFQLGKEPILPDESADSQREMLLAHWNTALVREAEIKRITAERFFVPPIFPPLYTVEDYQASIPDDGTLLTFFAAGGEMYGFLLTPEVFEGWHIGSVRQVAAAVNGFLKNIGVTDGNKTKTQKDLTSDSWKAAGRTLLKNLLGEKGAGAARFSVQFKRLEIIPDGSLWYLPFEALCLPSGKEGELIPLLLAPDLTISYAPAASLAFYTKKNRTDKPFAEIGLVPGTCFPREKKEANPQAIERIEEALPQAVRILPAGIDLPSTATASRISTLAVLNELSGYDGNWTLFSTGKSAGETIRAYAFLPWGAPETILLPGFRSAGEGGVKGNGDGSEIFVPMMTLMARGTQTILLSRWRTGGRSAYDLTEGLLTRLSEGELPPAAWRAELESFFETTLNLEEEPRYHGSMNEEITGESPFFWSGYLLLDRSLEVLDLPEEPVEAIRPEAADPNNPEEPDLGEKEKADSLDESDDTEESDDADKADLPADANTEEADAENTGKEEAAPKETDTVKPASEKPASEEPDKKKPGVKKPDTKKPDTKKQDTKKPKDKKPQAEEPKEESPKPHAPSPLSDDELKRADEEADDFYTPNHQP